ncbi:PorP/SprF family type IX secretion system membrane protein [Mucilaginibacter glaciei]|uniref:Type IX secretion system membrane protein PorP/SprF n=1 Tax=Mucilaginibacter glaciei TaxID=2772109 RepID=A0A926NMQ2_9SPHI|nr:type IX secretion system membrane protein PorP/SprF [Mucilaginibacter glaciei]MBD1392043.1 type IX secretion system membrane protein PorP/SprF [Mucilaginibacter glaciei]
MKRPNKYLLLMLLLYAVGAKAQQTIQLSQYMFNGLALNPAYAGYKDDWTINLSSRLQWTGFNGAPKTGTISADGLLNNDKKNVGIGVIATIDKLGPQNTSSFYANYAFRLRLNDEDTKRLSFGLAVGATQYTLDGSQFNATDGGDNSIPTASESKFTPDARLGIYYYAPKVYVGASVFNLLSATNLVADYTTLVRQVRTVYLTAGLLIPLTEYIDLKPSFMIKEDFKGPTNVDLTGYLAFSKSVWIGASYRTGVTTWKNNLKSGLQNLDAVAALAQVYVNNHFRIGYSFDFTVSKLAGYQSGSHELSLSFSLGNKKPRIVSPRYF